VRRQDNCLLAKQEAIISRKFVLLAACALNIQYIKCYGRERARKLPAHELALHKHHKGKLQMVLIIAAAKPHYNNVNSIQFNSNNFYSIASHDTGPFCDT
jgi:hypothetical protein